MNADAVTRLLLELIGQLPPNLRPGAGAFLSHAAGAQPYWTPVAVLLLALVVMGSVRLYYETA